MLHGLDAPHGNSVGDVRGEEADGECGDCAAHVFQRISSGREHGYSPGHEVCLFSAFLLHWLTQDRTTSASSENPLLEKKTDM